MAVSPACRRGEARGGGPSSPTQRQDAAPPVPPCVADKSLALASQVATAHADSHTQPRAPLPRRTLGSRIPVGYPCRSAVSNVESHWARLPRSVEQRRSLSPHASQDREEEGPRQLQLAASLVAPPVLEEAAPANAIGVDPGPAQVPRGPGLREPAGYPRGCRYYSSRMSICRCRIACLLSQGRSPRRLVPSPSPPVRRMSGGPSLGSAACGTALMGRASTTSCSRAGGATLT